MAILIEGMEMPDTCTRCDYIGLNVAIGCKVVTGTNGRTDNCPLIEVHEPHGNLIDADEIFVEFVIEGQRSKRYKLGEKWELNGEEIRSVISRLPTIIPASEEAE